MGIPCFVFVTSTFGHARRPVVQSFRKPSRVPTSIGKHSVEQSVFTRRICSIVGVVKDHTYRNRGRAPEPVLYRVFAQIPTVHATKTLIIHVRRFGRPMSHWSRSASVTEFA